MSRMINPSILALIAAMMGASRNPITVEYKNVIEPVPADIMAKLNPAFTYGLLFQMPSDDTTVIAVIQELGFQEERPDIRESFIVCLDPPTENAPATREEVEKLYVVSDIFPTDDVDIISQLLDKISTDCGDPACPIHGQAFKTESPELAGSSL